MSNELNAAPQMSLTDALKALAALQAEQRAKAQAAGIAAPVVASAQRDAFGARHGDGTHAIHVVLAEAYAQGVWLTRADIGRLAAVKRADGAGNHLNTMRGKGRVVPGARGLWRLSDAAAVLWHGEGKPFGFADADIAADTPTAEDHNAVAAFADQPIALDTPPAPPAAEVSPESNVGEVAAPVAPAVDDNGRSPFLPPPADELTAGRKARRSKGKGE